MTDFTITNTPRAGETAEQIAARAAPRIHPDNRNLVSMVERSLRSDPVSSPSHYKAGNGIEAIDVVEGFDLNPALTQVVTYVLRADKKGEPVKDLEKAQAYLAREIARRKHQRETGERYLPIGRGFAP